MELVLTHSNTDFDALASLFAASRLFPGALPVLPQRINRNLQDFLSLYRAELPFINVEDLPAEHVSRIILVDTQQVPSLSIPLGPFPPPVEILDHHPLSRELGDHERYTGFEVGATVTLLLPRMIERGEQLSPVQVTLLLLGIYEDTGSLSYPGTTPEDLRCAAWLLEHGASLHIMSEFLNRPLSEGQLEIYNQLVSTAVVHEVYGWPIVVAQARVKGYVEEISTLAHPLHDLYDPAALFLLVQLGGMVQIVARSNGRAVHVGEVMDRFGGGGHAQAAAAFLPGRQVDEIREGLLQFLAESVRPMRTAADIMTRRLHTISPQATLTEAAERMTRYGHGSLPVVDGEDRLVGLLTRRALDRALHHGLEGRPVATYMWKGPVTVPPDLPVEKVRHTMMDRDVGRLLVLEQDRRLVGIITRTDLLKLWPASPPEREGLPGIWLERLQQTVPPAVFHLLQRAGRLADQGEFGLYVVGGFVRDMMLGLSNLDLDLVVEGDAIALAQELSAQLGGRVRSHRRFGTAKWILEGVRTPDQGRAGLPHHLDFVTARTEFYEEPTALPTVEFSSLRHDLYRRDFTLNTLAIALSGGPSGRLFDFYGGKRDLDRGLIRALHNLSFIEDPTRILRAVRLEQRLDFRIEPRTLQLLQDALQQGLLERTTGERIRHELLLILEEASPGPVLARLDELGVLERISPRLSWDDWLAQRFHHVEQVLLRDKDRSTLYLALLFYRLPPQDIEQAIERYRFRSRRSRVLREVLQLRQGAVLELRKGLPPPSQIYHLLEPYSEVALQVLFLAEINEHVHQAVELYLKRLSSVRTELNGDDLKALGLAPGPLYKDLLGRLLEARLDGQVQSRVEEQRLLQELLSVEGLSGLLG
ncbi:MAG: CBS domain-containing protein [Chloroflexia bacterium]|nr:CBS domain-containing protein [Chloroflexia bacterium]